MDEFGEDLNGVNESLDLLTELVNTLKIEDATQTARIIENISALYSRVNQVKALGTVEEGDPVSRIMGQVNLFNDQFSEFMDIVDERLKNNIIKLRVKKSGITPISQSSLRKKKHQSPPE